MLWMATQGLWLVFFFICQLLSVSLFLYRLPLMSSLHCGFRDCLYESRTYPRSTIATFFHVLRTFSKLQMGTNFFWCSKHTEAPFPLSRTEVHLAAFHGNDHNKNCVTIFRVSLKCLIWGPFEKFVDSPYFSESELYGRAVTVSFSKHLPWQAMHLLQRSTPLLENMLQTVDHFEISCLGAPFSWLEKPRNRMARDLNWILCSARKNGSVEPH
jgi:hypothetical protein